MTWGRNCLLLNIYDMLCCVCTPYLAPCMVFFSQNIFTTYILVLEFINVLIQFYILFLLICYNYKDILPHCPKTGMGGRSCSPSIYFQGWKNYNLLKHI